MIADLVLLGGTIHTMDPRLPRAEAVAIRGGRFTAVGTGDDVRSRIGPNTHVIELRGRAVTPGLVDGHCHLYGLGRMLEQVPLGEATSARDAAARVAAVAATRPAGQWIEGWGWDQNDWPEPVFPTRQVLDALVPDHPVMLRRIDGHAIWVNSLAMRLAGIDPEAPDPPGGLIGRDDAGWPAGVFVDKAIGLIDDHVPEESAEARARMILRAADLAVAKGLTAVHEMNIDDETVAVYRSLAASGRLKLRVYAYLRGLDQIDTLPDRRPDEDTDGTAFFTMRGVKLFADGALGSRGAALLAPYVDEPENTGLLLDEPDFFRRAAALGAAHGWQLAIHAIGDRANRVVLDAYEAVPASAAGRFRVEHAQIVAAEDIPRFARLGVIASVQPIHATADMGWAIDRLGVERLPAAYAWRSISASGAALVGGSDFPVAPICPLRGIYAAVTRQDELGSPPGGWLPEQRLTLDEAIGIYTTGAARASFTEGVRGVIAPGYVADLTVFDRELSADRRLLETRVSHTIVGGRIMTSD